MEGKSAVPVKEKRQAFFRLGIAALLVLVALLLWFLRLPGSMTEDKAGNIAQTAAENYARTAEEPLAHFAGPQILAFDDGWEFRWVYRPCPDTGELRIFVPKEGRATYTLTPNCTPFRGFAVKPETV